MGLFEMMIIIQKVPKDARKYKVATKSTNKFQYKISKGLDAEEEEDIDEDSGDEEQEVGDGGGDDAEEGDADDEEGDADEEGDGDDDEEGEGGDEEGRS